ncbi:hypothetical protein ACTQV2_00635 [Bifidobacterium thermophilum]|uniref:hypothetical protein n=1 Tax=Bifidobacterium thermophilum TaxID=33905 RepID=UPI003F9003EA
MAQGIRDGRNFGWDERVRQARLDTDRDDEDKQYVKATLKSRTKLWKVMRVIELILVAFIAISVAQPAATPKAPEADLSPAGKQNAYAAVSQWLATGTLGSTGRIISWDGSRPASLKDGSKTVRATRQSFTVQTDANRWFRIVATVRTDTGQVVGYPSATPMAIDTTQTMTGGTADWPDASGTPDNRDAVETLLSQWGEAYAGADADRLKTVVADQKDPNAVYQPLMLSGKTSVSVDRLAYLTKRGKKDKNTGHTDMAVAQVTINVKKPDGSDGGGLTYDVLVGQPDGAARILAWGAPGTGPGLKEYSNRWHGTVIDAQTVNNQRQAAEASASASPSVPTQAGTGTGGDQAATAPDDNMEDEQ